MPQLTQVVFKAPGRRPAKYPFPFQELLPLKLNNSVSGKGDKQTSNICLQEMSALMACFKKNEFAQNVCSPEIQAFQKCVADNKAKEEALRALEKSGGIAAGAHRLSARQLNRLLKEHKQPT